jgi:hypothetical protein
VMSHIGKCVERDRLPYKGGIRRGGRWLGVVGMSFLLWIETSLNVSEEGR